MNNKLSDLHLINEKRKKIVNILSDEDRNQYFKILQTMFRFKKRSSDMEIDNAVRPLLKNPEQWKAHYDLVFSIKSNLQGKSQKAASKSNFQIANVVDYIPPVQTNQPPSHLVSRLASSEFFLPDSGFISTRINLHIWENGFQGVQRNVAELMVDLCHAFVKNILMAMISRKENYKIRDGLQYAFGTPTVNPILRNAYNIMDDSKQSNVDVIESQDSFAPSVKPTLEHVEQQVAFTYANSYETLTGGPLTLALLYDTLRNNPQLLGPHSISSVNMLKLSLLVED